jgi:hypothetical protein
LWRVEMNKDRIADLAARNAWDEFSEEDALQVLDLAAIRLRQMLTGPGHVPLEDDGGDYMYAATENFHRLYLACWEANPIQGVKDFLLEHPDEWLGCDGDIRFDLWSDEYVRRMQDEADKAPDA